MSQRESCLRSIWRIGGSEASSNESSIEAKYRLQSVSEAASENQ